MQLIIHGHRLASHGLALFAVTALVVVSAIAPHVTSAQSDPTPSVQEPALAQLEVPPLPTATPGGPTLGADQRQTIAVFDPRQGLPQWLHGTRDVTLWAAAESGAQSLETVPAT